MPLFLSGPEIAATGLAGSPKAPVTAALGDGGFVLVWEDAGDILARRFLADGSPAGLAVAVAEVTEGLQSDPAAVLLADGSLAVGWTSIIDGQAGIRARVMSLSGGADGPEFALHAGTAGDQVDLSLASRPGGGFLAAWTSRTDGQDAAVARQFGADGQPEGDAFAATDTLSGNQTAPSAAVLPSGAFVITWQNTTLVDDIRARFFDADGAPPGDWITVNSTIVGPQRFPEATTLADGTFLIVWQDIVNYNNCITARRFAADGTPLGDNFAASPSASGQKAPQVTALTDGGYAIAWEEYSNDYTDIFLRVFGPDDVPSGPAVRVHAPDAVNQSQPDVTPLQDGRLVLTWITGPASGSLRAQIVDPRVSDAETGDELTGTESAPRLMAFGDSLTVAAGAQMRVLNQHGIQTGNDGQHAVQVTVNGLVEVDADHGTYAAIRLMGTQNGIGDHSVTVGAEGTVRALSGPAICFAGTQNALTNNGVIEGEGTAFQGGDGSDSVVNLGRISGDLLLGAGNDTFHGLGGTVAGRVLGGTGDDLYLVSDASLAVIEGAAGGSDRLQSTVSLTLAANVERLDLLGGGNLNGTGNSGANVMTGNGGANRLSGAGGADRISAAGGNDRLYGDGGNDSLSGGSGNDRLAGGTGRDSLTGGSGADTFIFTARSDSRPGFSDLITDFRHGQDRIDLSALAGPKLAFLGTADFLQDTAAVRVDMKGGRAIVEIDLDGNTRADLIIAVEIGRVLSAGDFLL